MHDTDVPSGRAGFEWVEFDALDGVDCPCGRARRALMDAADFPGSIHVTDISRDARLHYHKRLTEVYYVLSCNPDAHIELDCELHSIRPGICVMIRPGTRHRVVGTATVLILVIPKFDPADEWFD